MRGLFVALAFLVAPSAALGNSCRIELEAAEWVGCDAGVPVIDYHIRLKGCGVGIGLTECTTQFVDKEGNTLGSDYFAPPDPSSCTLVGYGNQVPISPLAGTTKVFAEVSCGICGGDVLETRARIRGDVPACEQKTCKCWDPQVVFERIDSVNKPEFVCYSDLDTAGVFSFVEYILKDKKGDPVFGISLEDQQDYWSCIYFDGFDVGDPYGERNDLTAEDVQACRHAFEPPFDCSP